jgi:HD superfamily phosphohydrolase YqeK
MSRFEKVIYAADYIDPNRQFKESEEIFYLVRTDFARGILEICKRKMIFVLQKEEYLHPLSVLFYNELTGEKRS